MTQYIKAPFNFVPLNEKVFFPNWADQVSHDIPFSDGESGEIELELEAMTPVFVRNGSSGNNTSSNFEFSHCIDKNGEKRFFIPATTLKGMFRSVLEIMTNGYIRVDKKMKFSIREWDDNNLYPLKKPTVQTNIRCGWLKIHEYGNSEIIDCGLPLRINHLRIDEFFSSNNIQVSFTDKFSREAKIDLNREQQVNGKTFDPKSAAYKYALISNNFSILQDLTFTRDDRYYCTIQGKEMNPPAFSERRKMVKSRGDLKGTIVFTGQPDKWINPEKHERKMGAGKFYEFIFPKPEQMAKRITVSEDEIKHFKFIYHESEAWKLLKNHGEIPVFFRSEGNKLLDFGLALLYKLPYTNSVEQLAWKNQSIDKETTLFDLADAIFGKISTSIKNSDIVLKGRVQFGHAFSSGETIIGGLIRKRMGEPKASYLPFYIDQSQLGNRGRTTEYKHYDSKDAKLSGWKRYPVYYGANLNPPPDENPNLDTQFRPLQKGVKFISKVRFHNLRPQEIGALISAFTFHNNSDQICHSLGFAKPYGFGKVKVEIKSNALKKQPFEYLIEFENLMDEMLNGRKWIEQQRLIQLFSMAWDRKSESDDLLLGYMQMSTDKDHNDFLQAKSFKEYLESYTKLSNKKFIAKSLNAELQNKLAILKEEENKRISEELKHAEIRKKEEEDRLRQEKRQKEAEEGPLFLSSVKDFERAKPQMEQWLKKTRNGYLPDTFHQILFEAITRFYNDPKNRERKKWQEEFGKNHIWKKIASWVGTETASKWFIEITQ